MVIDVLKKLVNALHFFLRCILVAGLLVTSIWRADRAMKVDGRRRFPNFPTSYSY